MVAGILSGSSSLRDLKVLLSSHRTTVSKTCTVEEGITRSRDSLPRITTRPFFVSSLKETISAIKATCATMRMGRKTFREALLDKFLLRCHNMEEFQEWWAILNNRCLTRHILPHSNSKWWWNQICMEIGSSKLSSSSSSPYNNLNQSLSSLSESKFLFRHKILMVPPWLPFRL